MMICLDFGEVQIWAGILIGVSLSALGFFVYKLIRG
jgi:hypothetical protein